MLHSKLANPPLNTSEMIKKLTDCRNILVNQIEISSSSSSSSGGGGKSFVVNLGQLNLLIEQVQRLFNSLVSKMKESAGVISSISNPNPNNNNNNKISSSITASSSISSLHNSSNSSLSLSISSNSKQKTSTKSNQNDNFEKILIQRLSLPPDLTNNQDFDNWLKRFISSSSSRKPAIRTTNQKHLKQRNRLLNHELKSLNCKYHIQDCGLGNLNILIPTDQHRFIFQVTQKYPYDQLIYRIEAKTNHNPTVTLVPKNREPKTFPLTITCILRNFIEG